MTHDSTEWPSCRKSSSHSGESSPRLSAGPRDDGELVEYEGRILDEDRVRQLRSGGQALHLAPEIAERSLVCLVLRPRTCEVDGRSFQVRELAMLDGGRDVTRERQKAGCMSRHLGSVHPRQLGR